MRRRTPSTAPKNRLAFTLVELLIVIVILGILIGLLVPAVMRAVVTANNAAVSSELQSLSQALAAFKTDFGVYPPSRIVIAEDGDYSTAALGGSFDARLIARSTQYLRRLWPRMKISTDGTKPVISGGWYDVNGDGAKQAGNGAYMLQGHEALCIFLGGVPQKTDTGFAMMGFSKDPTNPFQGATPPPTAGGWPYSTNRTVPYMEFKPGYLKPTLNPLVPLTGQLPGYTDKFGGFIAYFSSYMGAGYDPNDVDIAELDEDGAITSGSVLGASQTSNAATPVGGVAARPDLVGSQPPNPYLSDTPLPITSAGAINAKDMRPKAYWNAQSYQLISAGKDLKYGIGGQWAQGATDTLPTYPAAVKAVTGQTTLPPGVRSVERDNITNFSGGALE